MIWGGGERGLQGVCEAINPKRIAKNFVYFSMHRLHDIERNRGPSDAGGRVATGRKADGAFVCKSQKNPK